MRSGRSPSRAGVAKTARRASGAGTVTTAHPHRRPGRAVSTEGRPRVASRHLARYACQMAVPQDIRQTLSLLRVRPGAPARPSRRSPSARALRPGLLERQESGLPSDIDPGDTAWTSLGERGIPARALVELASALGLSGAAELAAELGLAERTIQRRLAKRQALSIEEAEKSIRVARALVKARHVLEDMDAGARWLLAPSKALGGMKPLSLLGSGDGFTLVMDELGRIEHGVYS